MSSHPIPPKLAAMPREEEEKKDEREEEEEGDFQCPYPASPANATELLRQKNFEILNDLGEGGYGAVKLVRSQSVRGSPGKLYAAKVVTNPDKAPGDRTVLAEVRIHKILGSECKHVTRMLDVWGPLATMSAPRKFSRSKREYTYAMLFDLLDCDVNRVCEPYQLRGRRVPEAFVWHVARDVAAALVHLGAHRIVHHNLGSPNVLSFAGVDLHAAYPRAVVGDFGEADHNGEDGDGIVDYKVDVCGLAAVMHGMWSKAVSCDCYAQPELEGASAALNRLQFGALSDFEDGGWDRDKTVQYIRAEAPRRIQEGFEPLDAWSYTDEDAPASQSGEKKRSGCSHCS